MSTPPLSAAEIRRRVWTCRDAAEQGLGTYAAATRLNMKLSTLSQWLVDNGHGELRKRLGENSYRTREQALTAAEIRRRLKQRAHDEGHDLPIVATALALGLTYPALWKWLKDFLGGDSAQIALAELDDEVELP